MCAQKTKKLEQDAVLNVTTDSVNDHYHFTFSYCSTKVKLLLKLAPYVWRKVQKGSFMPKTNRQVPECTAFAAAPTALLYILPFPRQIQPFFQGGTGIVEICYRTETYFQFL